jgi:cellulose synthase/poly-beta-1,6-N-acetylglucosamine synthase-like glycosyltransferase
MQPVEAYTRWPDFPHSGQPPAESARRQATVRLVALAAVLATTTYLVWRATATLGGATLWLAVPLLALEGHSLLSLVLHIVGLWDLDAVPAPAPVTATDLRVAVLIPTYNEPYEILLPTIAAAVAMRLPHDTWVLDDGRRPWVAGLAGELGARYATRDGNAHAKAGNINALLPRLDADLIAVLDADHVARANFLTDTLGYFADPRVALVQTPQDFYNQDSFEHVDRPGGRRFGEQELFYRGLNAGRNRWNASFWCGTNAVVRLAALREVGGVAVESVTEDIHTTIRLHRHGWRTVYHNAVLAHGLAAANAEQYLAQRLRWGTGAMQVLRTENPAWVRGLRPMQRISYLATLLGWFDSWRILAYVLMPVAMLLSGATPVAAAAAAFLPWFASVFLLQRAALAALGRGRAPQWEAALFDFVRLPANLRATMTLFSRRGHAFTVTAKGRAATGTGRTRTAVPRLHTVLVVLSGLTFAWYLATLLGVTPLTYPVRWIAHGSACWLLFNAVLLGVAIGRIRHERYSSERRAAVRFDLDGEGTVDGVPYRLRDVSLTGASVQSLGGAHPSLRLGDQVWVSLDVTGQTLGLAATVRSVTPGAGHEVCGVEFRGPGPADAAALALALFGTGVTPRLVDAAGAA